VDLVITIRLIEVVAAILGRIGKFVLKFEIRLFAQFQQVDVRTPVAVRNKGNFFPVWRENRGGVLCGIFCQIFVP
jgi:hypothetical protein